MRQIDSAPSIRIEIHASKLTLMSNVSVSRKQGRTTTRRPRAVVTVMERDRESKYVEVLARYEGNDELASSESTVIDLYQ